MSERCAATTQRGTACTRRSTAGSTFCTQHSHTERMAERAQGWAAAQAAKDAENAAEMKGLATTLPAEFEPDLEQTMPSDGWKWAWRWVSQRNAFCQLRRMDDTCEVAVVCHCSACMDDMDKPPTCPKHCACCACRDCVCVARRETQRFDPNAGEVEPYWDSACQCDQCLEGPHNSDRYREHCSHCRR